MSGAPICKVTLPMFVDFASRGSTVEEGQKERVLSLYTGKGENFRGTFG